VSPVYHLANLDNWNTNLLLSVSDFRAALLIRASAPLPHKGYLPLGFFCLSGTCLSSLSEPPNPQIFLLIWVVWLASLSGLPDASLSELPDTRVPLLIQTTRMSSLFGLPYMTYPILSLLVYLVIRRLLVLLLQSHNTLSGITCHLPPQTLFTCLFLISLSFS
jgi:hypothetical protein